jgi:hypothetical protein
MLVALGARGSEQEALMAAENYADNLESAVRYASRMGAFGRRSGDRMRRREFIGLVGGAAGLAGRGASAAIKTHPGRRCILGLKVAVSDVPNSFALRFRGRFAGRASNLMLVGCYFC